MSDNRKRRKIDSIIIDDSDIVKFKEEISLHLLEEKDDGNDNDNDIDSNAERVIKQLSVWLRRTYSYDALCQLLTAEDIRQNTLDVDTYWLLHMTCTLHFSDFIVAIDDDRLIEYIRNQMDPYLDSSEGSMITSIVASMVLFLFDITTSQNNENKHSNANLIQTNELQFSLNPKLTIARCLHIIEEIAIRTSFSNMNEYSSSSKELHDAIKNTRNLKKLKSSFNRERSFEIDQSLLQPTYIEDDDFQKLVMTLKIISRDSNATAVTEWQIRQICRFSSCILKSCNNYDTEALEDFELIIKDSIFATIDRELRSTSVSSLDFTFNTWLTESCKSSEITAISFILNKVIGVNGNSNAINYETINGLIRLATTAASDGVAEDSSIQWLRSVCLIQHLAYITQNFDENSNSSKMELGLKLLSNWFDSVLGPISSGKQSETDLVNMHPLTGKSFGFACLAFCEIVEMVSEECLQIMCNAVRLRKAFNKDAADSFLQVGRTQLKAFLSLRKGANASDDAKTRSVEITEERIIQWCRTLDSTGQLPVAVIQQSNMIGVNGYKILLSCMKLLIADNPAIRENCNKIVKAMSTAKNPLCSIAEASEFIANESYESKLDIILATLSVPPAHKVHIKVALQTLQSVNGLISNLSNPSDNNNSSGLSYLESWKSSSRQSMQSVFTTNNADLRLKIAGLLITNLLQTITLLASQLHLAISHSVLSKELVNQIFIYWYEWMYEAIDIFSEDIDAINCLSSIFQAYLLGDSMGIIQFPGLALFISLGREQLVQKIFEILFAVKKVHNSDSIVRKFCGLLHAALSWTSSSFHCYYKAETQFSKLGDYLKAVHPLLISTYIWTYSCASTLSPLPTDFGFLLETICPIIETHTNKCGTVTLLTSPTFQTLLQWIISYRDFFCHDDLVYRMQPLLSMITGALRSQFDVNLMKGIKVRELQAKPKYFSQDKVDAKDCVYIWSILLDCVGPLFEINKNSKSHILDENKTLILKYLIINIANEINLYHSNSWQLWMKCAKADIEKYGIHPKSSISLFLALLIINEGYCHTRTCDNSDDYALWYSYLLSSRCMAVSKSINIDFHIGFSTLTGLTGRSSKSMTFYQIPLLLSSEVCNRIIMLGNKLQVNEKSDFSNLTVNSFANCIMYDISRMLDANSNFDDIHLFSNSDSLDNVIYSRTLGWTFLSASTTCRVDDSITKSSLTRILKIYKSATNDRKQKMLYFIVGLVSSFVLSSSYANLITVFLEDKNEEMMILPSSKMIELVSEELMSQLPHCIATDYVSKLQKIIEK